MGEWDLVSFRGWLLNPSTRADFVWSLRGKSRSIFAKKVDE
jgi:hypothetical protein